MKHSDFVAFIPARAGSKGIPNKNICKLTSKPLIYWVTKAAQDCPEIDEVYICTDSAVIRNTVLEFGFSKLKVIGRSAESATDTASSEVSMLEFAETHLFKNIILIQTTSPLLTSKDLSSGIDRFNSLGCDSLLSLVKQTRFFWQDERGFAKPINYNPERRPRRQDFEGQLVENGAFYISSREGFLKHKSRLFGKIGWVEMSPGSYFELDEIEDFIIIENLLNKTNQ